MDFMTKCNNCGKDYCCMDTTYDVDGVRKCRECLDLENETRPVFVQHVPNFVDGGTAKVFYFSDAKDFLSKIDKIHPLDAEQEYVRDENDVMWQSVENKDWWVMGRIYNFPIRALKLKKFNYRKMK